MLSVGLHFISCDDGLRGASISRRPISLEKEKAIEYVKIPEQIVIDVQKHFEDTVAKSSSEFWDKLMINGVPIPGVLSVSWLDQQIADPSFREIYAQERAKLKCQKCSNGRTKRHHRKCEKRGACHKERERSARNAEAACLEYGFFVHVRRGRYGKGVSMNAAGDTLLRALARLNALC